MNFLVAPPDKVLQWLSAKGYDGTLYDAFLGYVSSGSDLPYGTIYDHLDNRLQKSGFVGTIDDMLASMFSERTGIDFRYDAERKFFEDYTLDMFTSVPLGAITDDDGNYITDDEGNYVTDGT